jgi:hypothetical protein
MKRATILATGFLIILGKTNDWGPSMRPHLRCALAVTNGIRELCYSFYCDSWCCCWYVVVDDSMGTKSLPSSTAMAEVRIIRNLLRL